jgi:hypothetical protein
MLIAPEIDGYGKTKQYRYTAHDKNSSSSQRSLQGRKKLSD